MVHCCCKCQMVAACGKLNKGHHHHTCALTALRKTFPTTMTFVARNSLWIRFSQRIAIAYCFQSWCRLPDSKSSGNGLSHQEVSFPLQNPFVFPTRAPDCFRLGITSAAPTSTFNSSPWELSFSCACLPHHLRFAHSLVLQNSISKLVFLTRAAKTHAHR